VKTTTTPNTKEATTMTTKTLAKLRFDIASEEQYRCRKLKDAALQLAEAKRMVVLNATSTCKQLIKAVGWFAREAEIVREKAQWRPKSTDAEYAAATKHVDAADAKAAAATAEAAAAFKKAAAAYATWKAAHNAALAAIVADNVATAVYTKAAVVNNVAYAIVSPDAIVVSAAKNAALAAKLKSDAEGVEAMFAEITP
jgi:hypothetical protein